MEFIVLYLIPFAALGTLIGVVLVLLHGSIAADSRADLQSRLRRGRSSDTFDYFRTAFEGESISEFVISTVYDRLSNRILASRGFPVRPTDDLAEVFDISPGSANDLHLLIRDLAETVGAHYEPYSFGSAIPHTVADLVRTVASFARIQDAQGASTLLRASRGDDHYLRAAGDGNGLEGERLLLRADEEN